MVMRDPEGNISLPTIIAQPVPGEGGNPALAGEKPPPTVTVNVPIKVPGGRAGAGVFRNVGLGGMVPPEAHTRQAQVGADPTFSQAALGGNVPIRQVSVDPETGEEVETYRLGQPGEIGMQSPLLFTHEEVGTEAIAQSDPTIVAAVYIPPEYGGEEITGTLVTATAAEINAIADAEVAGLYYSSNTEPGYTRKLNEKEHQNTKPNWLILGGSLVFVL